MITRVLMGYRLQLTKDFQYEIDAQIIHPNLSKNHQEIKTSKNKRQHFKTTEKLG